MSMHTARHQKLYHTIPLFYQPFKLKKYEFVFKFQVFLERVCTPDVFNSLQVVRKGRSHRILLKPQPFLKIISILDAKFK